MSLFPAYSSTSEAPTVTEEAVPENNPWLENPSFNVTEIELRKQTNENESDEEITEPILKKTKRKKEKKAKRKSEREKDIPKVQEFDGTEEYYVDKNSIRGYLKVKTLHKPACPRYRIRTKTIGRIQFNNKRNYKRYYEIVKSFKDDDNVSNRFEDETSFSLKTKEFNESLNDDPNNPNKWIELVRHQDSNVLKLTKVQLAERKTNILDRGLKENPGNEVLLREYVDVILIAYPTDEVSRILEKLVAKEPTCLLLWLALIDCTQGSMARCVVPDVLDLYKRCMNIMYNKLGDDDIMLKLFKNCALFLRQSGLYEQFFALIKLALELNVAPNKFKTIIPHEKDQQTLVEYEEVILKSGLPMNEIWLRIEKLRQNYNFLPCPDNQTCSDPQRMIFNEDICHYIYPLIKQENTFKLVIIILKLLKIPIDCHKLDSLSLFNPVDNPSEFDNVEELLTIFLSINFNKNSYEFNTVLYDLIRDMNIGPSFINNNIGYEIYLNIITELLLICSDCFQLNVQKKIFIILWLKFERIQLIVNKICNKLTNEKCKKIKGKIKNFLKIKTNRNVLYFYTEYALIEYEMDNKSIAENILIKLLIENYEQSDSIKSELYYCYSVYIELLIKEKNIEKAIKVLTMFSLNINLNKIDEYEVTDNQKLLALTKYNERLNKLIFIERNVTIMELEQYFLIDYFINLIKIKIYYILLIKTKLDALSHIEIILKQFSDLNKRHKFIRENLYELSINIMEYNDDDKLILNNNLPNHLMYDMLERGLNEFPNNYNLLKSCTLLDGQIWLKIRTMILKHNTIITILFLIVNGNLRYKKSQQLINNNNNLFNKFSINNIEINVKTYKYRIVNLLKNCTDKKNVTKKNSLLWRLYLKSLFDIEENLDKCKNILYAALDECPWNKALYIDGSIYVPQELSQLQDLIIEKQLRIYAISEELEILRNDKF